LEEFCSTKTRILPLNENKIPPHSDGGNGVLVGLYFAESSHSLSAKLTFVPAAAKVLPPFVLSVTGGPDPTFATIAANGRSEPETD